MHLAAYVVGALASLGALASGVLAGLLVFILVRSRSAGDRQLGLILAAAAVVHLAVPVAALLFARFRRDRLALALGALSLLATGVLASILTGLSGLGR